MEKKNDDIGTKIVAGYMVKKKVYYRYEEGIARGRDIWERVQSGHDSELGHVRRGGRE